MKKVIIVFLFLLLYFGFSLKIESSELLYTIEDEKRLEYVIDHVENILNTRKEGSFLLPDGINTLTGEPVKWVYPNNYSVSISNFSNQQNFMKTLVSLSKVINNDKYYKEAFNTTNEFIKNYQSKQGLFYWGAHNFLDYDKTDSFGKRIIQSTDNGSHEIENLMPFYELFLEVDEEATYKYINQLWNSIYDRNTGDIKRHGSYSYIYVEDVFNNDIPSDIIQIDSNGLPIIPNDAKGSLPFVSISIDLAYAAYHMSYKTENEFALNWANYLMRQFNLASNPITGMTVNQYKSTEFDSSREDLCKIPFYIHSGCGDRAQRQFRDFGSIARESNLAWENVKNVYINNINFLIEIYEKFGNESFFEWASKYLESFLDNTYIKYEGNNYIIPMFNDGTVVYNYVVPEKGLYNDSHEKIDLVPLNEEIIVPLIRIIKKTNNETTKINLWNYLRDILSCLGVGDIGNFNGESIALNDDNEILSPYILMALLDIYSINNNKLFLEFARNIGDNIINSNFKRGYILDFHDQLNVKIDSIFCFSLILLDAYLKGIDVTSFPSYLSNDSYINGDYLNVNFAVEERGYDYEYIYLKKIK